MNRFVLARRGGQSIPLTIVGGPEGAGKTTLLRRLLTNNGGRHVAVVLDHPSALALDKSLIARSDSNTLVLHNGSACLSLDGEIVTALSTMYARHGVSLPDHVVVEASSTASPLRTAGYAYLPGFRPAGMVVVVSAPEVLRAKEEIEFQSTFEAQLQHAELLVLNQVDRVKPPALQSARRWLLQRTIRARLVESEHCTLPAAMILGTSFEQSPPHAIHAEWTPTYSVESDARRNRIVQPRHDNDYRAWLLTTRATMDAGSFKSWVSALPDSILRGDGVLRLTGERSHRFQFHRCGLRWSLTRGEPWTEMDAEPLSWISLVGFAETAGSGRGKDSESRVPAGTALQPKLQQSKRPPRMCYPVGDPEH